MKKGLLSFLFCGAFIGVYGQDYTNGNVTYENVLYYDDGNFFYDQFDVGATAIDDAMIISTDQNDAYDGAYEIAVDDTAFTNVPEGSDTTANPNTINTATQIIKGLLVSKHFYFAPGLPIVRLLIKLQNPTGTDKSVQVGIGSNLGSDNETELDSCSTGNTSLSNEDRWAITSDGYSTISPDGDPVNTWVRFGPGSPVVTTYLAEAPELGDDNLMDSLRVNVPANSYIYIVQFNRLDSNVIAAKANVSMFDNTNTMIANSLFAGITPSDYPKIVNWDIAYVSGLSSVKESDKIILVPNPNNGMVKIEFNPDNKLSTIRVVNVSGSVVLTVPVNAGVNSTILNTSALTKGVYFLQFNNSGLVKKMIKY